MVTPPPLPSMDGGVKESWTTAPRPPALRLHEPRSTVRLAARSRLAVPPTNPNGLFITDTSLDSLGPIDYLVVEFPAGASNFTGEMVEELVALVEGGLIRLVDILIMYKDENGEVDAMELSDLEDLGPLQVLEAELAELLAEDDVANLAAAMEPGSTAGVLIWENLWAAPFASAARRAGGQLIADGRIPTQAIIASIEADIDTIEEGA
jgi:hypothetical protein